MRDNFSAYRSGFDFLIFLPRIDEFAYIPQAQLIRIKEATLQQPKCHKEM
jgi:hypothetical protein